MRSQLLTLLALATSTIAQLQPNFTSPAGVEIYNPSSFFNTTGPWSLMSQAGDTVYISGMRGIHPENSTLAPTGLPRIRQAYENMRDLAAMAGAELTDCVRLVVYTTDMYRYRPMCNAVQVELWGDDERVYPPRTIVEVGRLNEDDILEVEGTFWNPRKGGGETQGI
ncbi:hypothetical protein Q7P35_000148 [Cladosporium inversicolor]